MQQSNRTGRPQNRSLRTRSHIVEAALRVFAMKGYLESSMEDVALAAGCSKGGLYHHFPAKSVLLAEVAGRMRALGGLGPPLGAISASTGIPEPLLGRLLLDLWAEASRDPSLASFLRAAGIDNAVAIGRLVQETVLEMVVGKADQAA